MFSLEGLTSSIHTWLKSSFNPAWALLLEFVLVGVCAIGLFATLGLVLVLMERKVAALHANTSRAKPGWDQKECFKVWQIPSS